MKRIRLLLAAAGLLTVGFTVGYEHARRSVSRAHLAATEKEMQEFRDVYFERMKELDALELLSESDDSDVEEVVKDEADRVNPVLSSESIPFKDYSKFAKAREDEAERQENLKKPYDGPVEDADDSEIYEDYDDDDVDEYNYGEYHPDNIEYPGDYTTQEPFQLSVDEFMDEPKMYDEISLQYFKKDKIVVDTSMVPVPDPEEFVGEFLKVFDNDEQGDTDVIFIRNNRMRSDIELIVEEEDTFNEALARWKSNLAARRAKRGERSE